MAAFNSTGWAAGATVTVKARDAFGNATGSAVGPGGTADSTGGVLLTGLNDATNYVATDGSRTVAFRTPVAGPAWGADASTTTVDNAIAYAQATPDFQMAPGKILLFGTSMGMITASNYARRFPSKVAGIVAVSGATDIDYHYANGYAANIDAAYGGSWASNGKTPVSHSPLDFASSLTVPLMMWYAPGDTTVPPSGSGSNVPFIDAYGGSRKQLLSTGVGAHNDAAWAGVGRQAVLAFAAAAAW